MPASPRHRGATLLVLAACFSTGAPVALSRDIRDEFMKVPWNLPQQAWSAYKEQYSLAKSLGRGTEQNPNRLIFYPENRVLQSTPQNKVVVTIFCLLSPELELGYRTNSVTLHILQTYHIHRRIVLAPKHNLSTHADQLNCWNYQQSSACWPLRNCLEKEPRSVGLVTMEGWGIFQIISTRRMQSHYQCVTETQSILGVDTRRAANLQEYRTIGSDVEPLLVYYKDIGEPVLHMDPSFERGSPLNAVCRVKNSYLGSRFHIDLVLKRPPPDGIPGPYRDEFLARQWVSVAETEGLVNWRGEGALLSHHGLAIECRVSDDWGARKGKRVARGQLMVRHMFPAYVQNPRIRQKMSGERKRPMLVDYYKSPNRIKLRMAEYAVCMSDGYPTPTVQWSVNDASAVWIIDDTMFITRSAPIGRPFLAICIATSQDNKTHDEVKIEVEVMASVANLVLPSILPGLLSGLLHTFLIWFSLQLS